MAKNVVERIEKNLSALAQLLGAEVEEDIKKRIADLIVERIASDLRTYDYYLFYPGDYKESIEEAFEKVSKKITKMYADAMLEAAKEAVGRFKDIALSAFDDTKGLKLRNCHECKYRDGNRCKFYDGYYWRMHDSICAEEGFINFEERGEQKKEKGYGYFNLK